MVTDAEPHNGANLRLKYVVLLHGILKKRRTFHHFSLNVSMMTIEI